MSLPDLDEVAWLGAAIFNAQRVEFVLYGIASHCSHLPEAQKDRRFRKITPEKFLRGDLAELKATLGQLTALFGDRMLIATPDLEKFCEDRNLIAHNYFRLFHADAKGCPQRSGGIEFLRNFTEQAEYWFQVLRGLLHELIRAEAEKHGRLSEFPVTPRQEIYMRAYRQHAEKYLMSRS